MQDLDKSEIVCYALSSEWEIIFILLKINKGGEKDGEMGV